MAPYKNRFLFFILILSVVFSTGFISSQSQMIPVTGMGTITAKISSAPSLTLNDFLTQVQDGSTSIRGIYNQSHFAYQVVQQPSGQPGFVSAISGVVTQFGLASQYGSTGLLAHNFAAGALFSEIEVGDSLFVVFGNGSYSRYEVTELQRYQALQPNSATSQFVDLSTQSEISASQLFTQVYAVPNRLVLQTCIQNGNEDSWGRLFVIAEPEA